MNDIEVVRKKAFEDLREILDINERGFAVRYYQCKTDDYVWKYADGAWEYKGNMTHDRILGRDCCPIDLVRKNCHQYMFSDPKTTDLLGEWAIKSPLPPTCQRVGSPIPGESDIAQDDQKAGDSNKDKTLIERGYSPAITSGLKKIGPDVPGHGEITSLQMCGNAMTVTRGGYTYALTKDQSEWLKTVSQEADRISKITNGLCK